MTRLEIVSIIGTLTPILNLNSGASRELREAVSEKINELIKLLK